MQRKLRIFISYRRTDSRKDAARIHDRLAQSFGAHNIFKDVDDIRPGHDFRLVLARGVDQCEIMLVIIGPNWLNIEDENGYRRLDNPDDYVRFEVERGLASNRILVIPVLVDNALMPSARKLPPSLQSLTYRNAIVVRDDPDFHRDMGRLIAFIQSPDAINQDEQTRAGIRKPVLWLTIGGMIAAGILSFIAMAIFINGLTGNSHLRMLTTQSAQVPTQTVITTTPALPLQPTKMLTPTQSPITMQAPSSIYTPTATITLQPSNTSQPIMPTSTAVTENGTPELCYIQATRVNVPVHVGPAENRNVRGALPIGYNILVTGQANDDSGGLWWKIQPFDNNTAEADRYWVSEQNVTVIGNCTSVQFVDASPLIGSSTTSTSDTANSGTNGIQWINVTQYCSSQGFIGKFYSCYSSGDVRMMNDQAICINQFGSTYRSDRSISRYEEGLLACVVNS